MNNSNFIISDKDYKILNQKIKKLNSKYNSTESDWRDFWCGETIGIIK
tara:strand:- start:519 stop:662 length:144 start_codon:yes stop_codon:yes gene_type:complete